jgi:glycosyltransferase involved in cell wall biosynthesis
MHITVVISYYNARDSQALVRLLESMLAHTAGCAYNTLIVVNRAVDQDLILPDQHAHHSIIYRPNTGYNIGAWDHGWRSCNESDFFLFLQDDCVIHRDNWLRAFVRAAAQSGVGLIGESINWNRNWEELVGTQALEIVNKGHFLNGQPATKKEVFFDTFQRWNVDPGVRADHLQSVIWAAKRDILERIQGFPIGMDYGQAIAAEIATSKKIQAAGFRIKQVHWKRFYYIYHPEWNREHTTTDFAAHALRDRLSRNSLIFKILNEAAKWIKGVKVKLAARALRTAFQLSNFWESVESVWVKRNMLPPHRSESGPSSKPRILFVDDNLPDPRNGAGYPRAKVFLQALVDAGCTVDHYSLAQKSPERLEPFLNLHPNLRFFPGSGIRGLRSLRLSSRVPYDMILVSRAISLQALILAGWLPAQPSKRPYRVVYDSEAITSAREQLRVKLYPPSLYNRLFARPKYDEWALARQVDALTVVSEHDAALVRANLSVTPVVVSYPVEVRTHLPEYDQRRDILFVGRLTGSHRKSPNIDGLLWFLTEVLPLLDASELSECTIHIVGEVNSPELLALSSGRIRFYNKVDDVTPFFDAARIFIAPARFAAGIPIKVLDSICNGVPCVATPILRYQLGMDAMYPESFPDPVTFAQECIRLYTDRAQWHHERRKQQLLVESRYSLSHFRQQVDELLALHQSTEAPTAAPTHESDVPGPR